MKKKVWEYFHRYGCVVLSALMTAVAIEICLIPNRVIYGSAMGIASIIEMVLGEGQFWFSAGIWVLALNVPLLIFAAFNFSKKFTVRTIIYVLLLSIFMTLLRYFNVAELLNFNVERDKVALVLMGGCLIGVAFPLMLSVNGSTSGSDVIGLFLQTKLKVSSSESFRYIMFIDAVVILVGSLIMKDVVVFVYSIVAILVGEVVKEIIFRGFSSNLEIEITTDKPEEMSEALKKALNHGTTILKGIGGYSRTEKNVVVCIINKRQLTLARKIILSVDPSSFAYIQNVKEVMGVGFSDKEAELDFSKDD